MIKELRVDDRLIHGQVALTWPKHLSVSHIIVANDAASKNQMQADVLKMAVQGIAKVIVRDVDDAIKLLLNSKAQSVPMFVIVNQVEDAEKIFSGLNGQNVERINIANVGRFDGLPKDQKTAVSNSILLTKDGLSAAKKLISHKANVVHQVIPTDKVENFETLLKEK